MARICEDIGLRARGAAAARDRGRTLGRELQVLRGMAVQERWFSERLEAYETVSHGVYARPEESPPQAAEHWTTTCLDRLRRLPEAELAD